MRCTLDTAIRSYPHSLAMHMHMHIEIHWKARVIAREDNTEKRKVKEALAIKRLATQCGSEVTMNQETDKMVSKLWLDLA